MSSVLSQPRSSEAEIRVAHAARERTSPAVSSGDSVDESMGETLERIERLAGVGTFRWDLRGGKVVASARTAELLGQDGSIERITAESLWASVREADRLVLDDALRGLLAGAQTNTMRVHATAASGTERALDVGLECCAWRDGVVTTLFGTVQEARDDATDARIKRLVCYDALTGLPNKILFREQVTYAIRRAARDRAMVALLSIDIDDFRRINDTVGHQVGDRYLKTLSSRIGRCVRGEDVIAASSGVDRISGVARMGGDEFAVLLSRISEPQDAARVARRILETAGASMMLDDDEFFPSLSIGISLYPWDAEDVDSLIRSADTALGHAKESGRSNAHFYSKSMNALAADRLAIESGLRKALQFEEFVLHYQPRVDSTTGKIVSNEALIRWQHPERGLVGPGGFIDSAEHTRLIIPIGAWVLEQACRQNVFWGLRGLPPTPVSVNISAIQFRQPGFAATVRRALEETQLDPRLLELELTESTLMDNSDEAAKILLALKELGVRIAIDDFGTGFSSLAYLKVFPADTLKIDRSFVSGLPGNTKDASITCAIIDLSSRLGMSVVAEGVETVEQLHYLAQAGCREVQGFLFARPMEPHVLEGLWLTGKPLAPASP